MVAERSDELETFTSGLARAVDVASIERELARVWQLAGEAEAEASGAVVRASVFNLIVYAPSDGEAASGHTVSVVSAELPCRALVILEQPSNAGTSPPLEAYISAHCQPASGGRKQVCCEQVTIRAARTAVESLPSTVLALLVPDLPTVLWWPGAADLGGALLRYLGRYIDRLVVDSRTSADPATALLQLDEWRRARPELECIDLQWERLDVWRELVAGFFDTSNSRPTLEELRQVRVVHAPGAVSGALLLAGWLASCLEWRPRSRHGDRWELLASRGGVALEIREEVEPAAGATASAGASPELVRVELHTAGGTSFRIEPDPRHPDLIVASFEHAISCPLPKRAPVRRFDPETELARRLQRMHRSAAFEAALAAAAQLLSTRGSGTPESP